MYSSSSSFSFTRGGLRTIASIFLPYLASICDLYSGRMSIAAKLKAALRNPARWHSITVEVRIGTTSATGLVIFIRIVVINDFEDNSVLTRWEL